MDDDFLASILMALVITAVIMVPVLAFTDQQQVKACSAKGGDLIRTHGGYVCGKIEKVRP